MNSSIQKHIDILKSLQTSRGLFLASSRGVKTGYDKAWLRDNFYVSLAFEETSNWETVRKIWQAILDILIKHESKIDWAIKNRPYESWQYIHARYNPETFEEFWEEWGNKQNDAVGSILFKIGDLENKGQKILRDEKDKLIIQKLVDYLYSIRYWEDPDSGVWEEGEEIHASSLGAVVAGLKKISLLNFISLPSDIIRNGEDSLAKILPRESTNKFTDLSLLSLIYPFEIINEEQSQEILKNITYHLEKRRGIIRYKNDRYYNKNSDGYSEEAEWTMGFSWLAIIYKMLGDINKAEEYLEKAKLTLGPDDKIPELYFSNTDRHNENIPLGWAESLFIIALAEMGSEHKP